MADDKPLYLSNKDKIFISIPPQTTKDPSERCTYFRNII